MQILRRFIRDRAGRIVPACTNRMIGGRITYAEYEKSGTTDRRDYLAEANDEILDGINYVGMWVARSWNGASDDPVLARYFRHLQSAHVLLQILRTKERGP